MQKDKSRALWIALLLTVCVAGPLVFGLPIHTERGSGADANFALQCVTDYIHAIHSGQWFPRWIAGDNSGYGSPVFYFYGRLPFLFAAMIAVVLHAGAVPALLLAMIAVRLMAFFTCRLWLREHASAGAADLGALAFVAMPFAMLLNPIARVGYAEIFATSLIPLLLLVLDRETPSLRLIARQVVFVTLVYAALAASHLPQTLLAFAIVSLYLLLARGLSAFLTQAAGAAGGLLLSAPNVVPALALQRYITPSAWRADKFVDVRHNFLFTMSRYRVFKLDSLDIFLYATWLLCAAILLTYAVKKQAWKLDNQRGRALFLSSTVGLLAMTALFWPVWVYIPQLRTIQFPWRLFPAVLALVSGVVALLAGGSRKRQGWTLATLGVLIAGQFFVVAAGGFASLSHGHVARKIPAGLRDHLPGYVPWAQRYDTAIAAPRSFPPEYIPASAGAAGWHVSADKMSIVNASPDNTRSTSLPLALAEPVDANGDIELRGTVTSPATVLLHSFYFPDEQISGSPQAAVSLDAATGLARVTVPAGMNAVRAGHDAPVPGERASHIASVAAFLILLALLVWSFRKKRAEAMPVAATR